MNEDDSTTRVEMLNEQKPYISTTSDNGLISIISGVAIIGLAIIMICTRKKIVQ